MTSARTTITAVMSSLLVLIGCQTVEETPAAYPKQPIKLIVPFGAGGGSDTFARILVKAIEDNQLLPQPIVIINVPGAGGTVGSRRVKNARPDGYTLMQLHEGIVTSKYSGQASYGPESFEAIAALGSTPMIIGVGENSPYASLKDLMDVATQKPDEVIFSANIGAPSQYAGLMLEEITPGAKFRYAQTGDGAKRFAGLQGGHTDVSSFSLGEYMQFKSAGLKAIALLDEERHPDALEIPTALEQGFDVVSTNMQFWWTPKDVDPERIKVIAIALERAMQTDEVQRRLNQLNIRPMTMQGEKLRAELERRESRAIAASHETEIDLPNFPASVLGVVIILAIMSIAQAVGARRMAVGIRSGTTIDRHAISTAVAVMTLTTFYVAAMQLEWSSYRFGTLFYLFALALVLTRRHKRLLATSCGVAILLSFGLHYLFTNIFVIDLP